MHQQFRAKLGSHITQLCQWGGQYMYQGVMLFLGFEDNKNDEPHEPPSPVLYELDL